MKSSENFKKVIQNYLTDLANQDTLFAITFQKENKNINDCITYILNQVQKSGLNGFEDSEIFGMAIHYYDEDNLEIGTPTECKIITNHHVALTDEEIAKAKQAAIDSIIQQERSKLMNKSTSTSKQNSQSQTSLF